MPPAVDAGEGLPSRYRVPARLGRGAFAQALHCEDTEGGGEVVVKLYELRERAWSPLTSFEREAQVLAELAHPAIPRYVAHAQLTDGRLMLVQSFAPGRSLAELLRSGRRFTDDEVSDLAEQVLAVLGYLQSFNPPIVHRDVKPANLVWGDDGRVRLVDFGSVKAEFRRDLELGSTIVGTYGYMAPEQFQGRASVQSDLYGLGATLLHLLSHIPPSELPQDGLKLDFHDHVKASPGTIAWLDRMLEPDPRLRFADAKQALAAFRTRDEVVATQSAPAGLVRREPPHGSRVRASEEAGELRLLIPGSGLRGPGLMLLGFSGFWLAFVAFWTAGAARGSRIFALFSLPFWATGLWLLGQALSAMFMRTTLRIGAQRYSITRQLLWHVRQLDGRTSDLAGASFGASSTRVNGQQLTYCVLHTGADEIKFGAQLGLAERRWLVSRINQHLGLASGDADID